MPLPTFLVVGAIKAGTTALYQYMIQHPEIYLSPERKESRFLTGLSHKTNPEILSQISVIESYNEYEQLFSKAKAGQQVGEIDPWYLYLYDAAIPRIKQYLSPDVKIIISLRSPAERALSNYYQGYRQGLIKRPFDELTSMLPSLDKFDWYERMVFQAGSYSQQVAAYLAAFPRKQVFIFLYEDFQANPQQIYQNICEFIGVDATFQPDMSYKANKGGIPKNQTLHRFLTQKSLATEVLKPLIPIHLRRKLRFQLINTNLEQYPALSQRSRHLLNNYYKDDIQRVQALIDRDVTRWVKTSNASTATADRQKSFD